MDVSIRYVQPGDLPALTALYNHYVRETAITLDLAEQTVEQRQGWLNSFAQALAGEDIHRIFGGITLPNDASVALHRAMGFEPAGVYPEVGRKFGHFWDVGTYLKPFGR
jgi:L-amino acid N-acyltransferase YncA